MNNCTCDAYHYPHRIGGGACDECGCPEAPHCEHWIVIPDPFCTGDFGYVEFERVRPARPALNAIRRPPK